jgi:hypothetical protein
MKLCQILCGLDRTLLKVKQARQHIPPTLCNTIHGILDNLPSMVDEARFDTPYTSFKSNTDDTSKPWIFTSDDTDEVLFKLLESHGINVQNAGTPDHPVSPTILAHYCRVYLRKREKEAFVEIVGSEKATQFIVHVCHFLPPFLTEMWECVDMSMLAGAFFKMCSNVLDLLKDYQERDEQEVLLPGQDAKQREIRERHEYDDLICKIEEAVYVVFEKGYPMVHELSKKKPKGPNGCHEFVDWLGKEFGWGVWDVKGEEEGKLIDEESLTQKRYLLDMRTESVDKMIQDCLDSGKNWEAALQKAVGRLYSDFETHGVVSTNHYQSSATDTSLSMKEEGWLINTYGTMRLFHELMNEFGGVAQCKKVYMQPFLTEPGKLSVRKDGRVINQHYTMDATTTAAIHGNALNHASIVTGSFESLSLTSSSTDMGERTTIKTTKTTTSSYSVYHASEMNLDSGSSSGSSTFSSSVGMVKSVWRSMGGWGGSSDAAGKK